MLFAVAGVAQEQQSIFSFEPPSANEQTEELRVIHIHSDISTHFIAMEDIVYVDISTNYVVGDIPVPNTLRVRPIQSGANAVVTIVTERYMVQYLLVYTEDMGRATTRYNIPYADVRSFMNAHARMTRAEMYSFAHRMFVSRNRFFNVATTAHRLRMTLNNIYTIDNYFFIDISLRNRSNIQFDIDQIRFRIEDRRQTRATNFQSIEIEPIMQVYNGTTFRRNYRNVFAFPKFTFPEDKVLVIEISEQQISGRRIILRVNYSDILRADAFVL